MKTSWDEAGFPRRGDKAAGSRNSVGLLSWRENAWAQSPFSSSSLLAPQGHLPSHLVTQTYSYRGEMLGRQTLLSKVWGYRHPVFQQLGTGWQHGTMFFLFHFPCRTFLQAEGRGGEREGSSWYFYFHSTSLQSYLPTTSLLCSMIPAMMFI